MKLNLPPPVRQPNRRSFLKSQAILSLGVIVANLKTAEAATSPDPSQKSALPSDAALRAQYLTCLGGTFPDPIPLNPLVRDTMQKEGYVVICPDALCFGERQDASGKLKNSDYERFEFLREVVRGRSLAWVNISDMRRAIDLLCERPEVRPDRLGCYGHSMGSTHCWLVGPLEPRLKCIAGNCCLPTYEGIEQKHLLHCFPNFVPGWAKFGDTPEIASLIAPRPLHLNLGEKDDGSPIESARRGLKRIAEAYEKAGASSNFTYFIEPNTGHVLSEAMWQRAKECFARHLKLA